MKTIYQEANTKFANLSGTKISVKDKKKIVVLLGTQCKP